LRDDYTGVGIMPKTLKPVKNKKTAEEAFKSAEKIVKKMGIKGLKAAKPSGRPWAALVAEEEFGNKYDVVIESTFKPTTGGVIKVSIKSGDTDLEIAIADVDAITPSAKDQAILASLEAAGLV